MKQGRINYYLSNLNVANIIIGYILCVSLLVPFFGTQSGASQLITIPYRGFSLFLSLSVITLNLKSRIKLTYPVFLLFLFWIAVLARMFYDLEIRTDFFVFQSDKSRVWLIAIAGCLVPMFSIFKSIKIIDFDYCLKLIYNGCVIILIPSLLFSLSVLDGNTRDTGNVALDAISFASIGITMSLLCIHKIIYKYSKKNKIKLFLNIILGFLGLYLALQSASRGPVLSLLLIVVFLFVVHRRKGLFTFSFILTITFLLKNFLVNSVGILAPFLAKRFNEGLSGDDLSILARLETYTWFIEQISKYPFLGSKFARLGYGQYPGYAHNIILDILLGFGIVGLIACSYIICIAFKIFIHSIRIKKNSWVGLIMMQQVLLSLTSGAYYSNPALNCVIILTLLLPLKSIDIN